MKLVPADNNTRNQNHSEVETLMVSSAHLEFLASVSHQINPDMPAVIGQAHLIRTLLERFEESGLDLSDASTEDEVASSGAALLRTRRRA